jgi:hypothetical protein
LASIRNNHPADWVRGNVQSLVWYMGEIAQQVLYLQENPSDGLNEIYGGVFN